jgi:hypothetical protein
MNDKECIWWPTGKDMKGADNDKIWLIYSYFFSAKGEFLHTYKNLCFLNENTPRIGILVKYCSPLAQHHYSYGFVRHVAMAAAIVLTLWKNWDVIVLR